MTDLVGLKFQNLLVLRFSRATNKQSFWICRCILCGSEIEVRKDHLRTQYGCKKCSNKNKIIDMAGRRYGRLLVIKLHHRDGSKAYWECLCDCGKTTILRNCALTSGNTKSCGCLGDENRAYGSITHGMSKTEEYRIWSGMITRCENTHRNTSKRYVNRGIKVCDRWRFSFKSFLEDMGPRPSSRYTIDRINNDGNYEPSNCRWATIKEQANNKSTNVKFIINGESISRTELCRKYGINQTTFRHRINSGYSLEDALRKCDNRFSKNNIVY